MLGQGKAADVHNWIFGCLTANYFVKIYEKNDRLSKKYMINFYDTLSVDQLIHLSANKSVIFLICLFNLPIHLWDFWVAYK